MNSYEAAEYQYRMTQLLEATIEMEGMKADNAVALARGEEPVFIKSHFDDLILKHGIHHNAAVEASIRIRNGG